MKDLNERELLLLSNYLYMDKCTQYRTIGEMLDDCRGEDGTISAAKVSGLGIGGCMSVEEGCDLIRQMDAQSEDFKNLNIARYVDAGELRGICFDDDSDSESAMVVFRGTGGSYEAWADNVKGEYLEDTRIQKLADDFIRYDCGVYENITVSGHSKGGNLAQYVTVLNADRVGRCVSFDGQGFSDGFREKYASLIAKASPRIKSISAHNDYVNILLGSIALTQVFVKNRADNLADCHSSYALLKSCMFDDKGNIKNTTLQSPLAAGAGILANNITDFIDRLPGEGQKAAGELMAASVAAVFSNELSAYDERVKINNASGGVWDYLRDLIGIDRPGCDVTLVAEEVYVDVAGLNEAAALVESIGAEMRKISERLADLQFEIGYKAASRIAVDVLLKRMENETGRVSRRLYERSDSLKKIAGAYRTCEMGLVLSMKAL